MSPVMSWLGVNRGQKSVPAQIQSYLGKKTTNGEEEEEEESGREGRKVGGEGETGKGNTKLKGTV